MTKVFVKSVKGPFRLGEESVFDYVYQVDKDDSKTTAWLMSFYDTLTAVAFTYPKEKLGPLENTWT